MEFILIVLHISILNGQFLLWTESEHVGNIRELKKTLKIIADHTSTDTLKINSRNTIKSFAFLPSYKNEFIPSSHLIKEINISKAKPVLMPYLVESMRLSMEELFIITGVCSHNIPGIIFGQSIKALKALIYMCFSLMLSENYYPIMIKSPDSYEARWLPFLNEDFESKVNKLIEQLPPVCRCMNNDKDKVPDISSAFMVHYCLKSIVDHLMRKDQSARVRIPNNVHDAWLNALQNEDPVVEWKDKKKEIEEFYKQLQQWQRPVELSIKSPFKLCFKLIEPEKEDEEWLLENLIQSKKDPSLFIQLEDIFNPKKKKKLPDIGIISPEFILSSLGQASAICPHVAGSLKHKNPSSSFFNTDLALSFLQEYAEILRTSGFTVLLPAWWIKGNTAEKLKLSIHVKSSNQGSTGILTLNSLHEFDYQASLGNEQISAEELQAMAKMKKTLIKFRGQWIQIDQNQLSQMLKYLQKQKNQTINGKEVLYLALGMEKDLGGICIENIIVEGWLKDLIDLLKGKKEFKCLEQPKSINGILRDYQLRGYSWLAFLKQWGLGACLADDMGLGKTIQTLALLQENSEKRENKPSLLICPTSVVNNWKNEIEKFTPNLKIYIHYGSKRLKKKHFCDEAQNNHLVISSYGLLQKDVDFLKETEWNALILDEAQNIKNSETKQSKAARSIPSEFRIALTGTPVENHVGDIWSLMEFLNPGILGSASSFKTRYHKPIQLYQDEEIAKRLKSLTSPFILRRLKTDKSIIKDLPEKIEVKDYCNLSKEQASIYQAIVNEMAEKIQKSEGIERKGLVLSTLLRLKQVCNHPVQYLQDNSSIHDRSGKLNRLRELLDEINEIGESTLIFTQFTEMGKILQKFLQEQYCQEVFFLHGSLTKTKRDHMVEEFQNNPKAPKIFILSLKAGGSGLNLTQANHIIHFDRWWNPAVENQATDRAFRIGQNKNVQVHKFIVAGTLEEKIDAMIERKKMVSELVIKTGENWLNELSNEDFINLIQLSKDSTGD